ncbi:hypothetical protein ACP70R_023449 [Stipagrostis hirtigluma subsp. patula]
MPGKITEWPDCVQQRMNYWDCRERIRQDYPRISVVEKGVGDAECRNNANRVCVYTNLNHIVVQIPKIG